LPAIAAKKKGEKVGLGHDPFSSRTGLSRGRKKRRKKEEGGEIAVALLIVCLMVDFR